MSKAVRVVLVSLLLIAIPGLAIAQEAEPSSLIRLMTNGNVGGGVGETDDLYQVKYGAGIGLTVIPANLRFLGMMFNVDLATAPLRTANSSVSLQMIRPEAGVQFRFPIGDTFAAYLQATGGYSGGRLEPIPDVLNDTGSVSSVSFRGGAGIEAVLGSFVLGFDFGYDSFVNVFDSINGRVSLGWQFGGRGVRGDLAPRTRQNLPLAPQPLTAQADLVLSDFSVDPVFPVLYKYYDDVPLGTVTLTNAGDTAIESVEVELDMATYIDRPKVSGRFDVIEAGESVVVELGALFNQEVQDITEGDVVLAAIRTTYRIGDAEGSDEESYSIEFYDRNAIRWDDDNKVAAFVTTRDTELQPLARNLAAVTRQNRRDAVDSNFQLGLMMFLGMVDQGLAYVIDPQSAYEQLSQNPFAVDSVQFPRQTLNFRGGDCDDLSVTFATLLESAGVPTAFLTIPGHLFVAFKLDMTADEARSTFGRPDDLIFRGNEAWVPVEITLLETGFVEAWTTGARQWREYDPQGLAGFYPTAEAWNTYQPVAYRGDEQLRPFNEVVLEDQFVTEMTSFVRREIADRELTFKARLQRAPNNARLHNRLGVLYARYGLNDEAAESFETSVELSEYAPALANLGNLAFLSDDFDTALDYYERAVDEDPRNQAGILGLARVSHELENYGTVTRYYDQIKELNPGLALQFSYLELRGAEAAAARASDAAQSGSRVFWGEEEDE